MQGTDSRNNQENWSRLELVYIFGNEWVRRSLVHSNYSRFVDCHINVCLPFSFCFDIWSPVLLEHILYWDKQGPTSDGGLYVHILSYYNTQQYVGRSEDWIIPAPGTRGTTAPPNWFAPTIKTSSEARGPACRWDSSYCSRRLCPGGAVSSLE